MRLLRLCSDLKPEEVEEQLEASTDSDMDGLAEKLGFVSINFTLAASPPSYKFVTYITHVLVD